MKIYRTILYTGPEKIPVVIVERLFHEEDMAELVQPMYEQIVKNLKYTIKRNEIIYLKNNIPEIRFTANQEFIDASENGIVNEFHIFILNREEFFIKFIVYKDKPIENLTITKKPTFNVRTKKGQYLNFYKRRENVSNG